MHFKRFNEITFDYLKSDLHIHSTYNTDFGAGKRISNFIHINRLLEILRSFIIKDVGGIFNVGNESLSYLDLAKRMINDCGNESSIIIKKKDDSKAKFILDLKKMEKD